MAKTVLKHLKSMSLVLLTLLGVLVGLAVGFGIRHLHPSQDAIMWLGILGEVYLRLLRMMIIPLIVAGIISGTARSDPKANGKISAVALSYIIITNLLGSGIGVAIGLIFRPGDGNLTTVSEDQEELLETQDIIADLIRNLIPDNIVEACIHSVTTTYDRKPLGTDQTLNDTANLTMVAKKIRKISKSDGTNILGLVFVSVIFGIGTGMAKEAGKPLLNLFSSLSEVTVRIMRWFLWYTPIGVLSLTAAAIAEVDDLEGTFTKLGFYVGVTIGGFLVYHFVILQLIYVAIIRQNPFKLHWKAMDGVLAVFASSSSAIALPNFYNSCDNFGIDKRVSRFVFPLCVASNSDASAIFISSTAVFLAQVNEVPQSAAFCFTVWAITGVGATALPGVPSASLVLLLVVLAASGVPTKAIAILFTIEWLMDRVRSTVNAVSHCYCTAITYHLCKKDIERTGDGEIPPKRNSITPSENIPFLPDGQTYTMKPTGSKASLNGVNL